VSSRSDVPGSGRGRRGPVCGLGCAIVFAYDFLSARHAKLLKDDGPYGHRCLLVDLNELFKSEKRHCAACQVREKKVKRNGEDLLVKEYYHQAVALVWASGETPWPIGWELLKPGEGELTAALRLLGRLLPRLRKSADVVMGDDMRPSRGNTRERSSES